MIVKSPKIKQIQSNAEELLKEDSVKTIMWLPIFIKTTPLLFFYFVYQASLKMKR